jgi:general secretion pathway protein I
MPKQRQAGFTLAEVLVALAVLAIALGAIMGVMTQAARTSIALADRTQALWVATDRLTLQQLEHDFPAPDTTTGIDEMGGREWHWRMDVRTTPQAEIRSVTVEVRLADDREALAHVAGYLRKQAK